MKQLLLVHKKVMYFVHCILQKVKCFTGPTNSYQSWLPEIPVGLKEYKELWWRKRGFWSSLRSLRQLRVNKCKKNIKNVEGQGPQREVLENEV